MSMSVGSTSSADSYLQQLNNQSSTAGTEAAKPLDPVAALMDAISGSDSTQDQSSSGETPRSAMGAGAPPFGTDTMSALISAQGQSADGSDMSSKMFAAMDTDGDGQVSKSEFEAFSSKSGADSATVDGLFAKLDSDGNGYVSKDEMAMKPPGQHGHMADGDGPKGAGSSAGANALDAVGDSSSDDSTGSTTTTTTNSDGSTTKTTTFADGTSAEMTLLADNNGGNGSSNLVDQLIKMQSQLMSVVTPIISSVV